MADDAYCRTCRMYVAGSQWCKCGGVQDLCCKLVVVRNIVIRHVIRSSGKKEAGGTAGLHGRAHELELGIGAPADR